MALFDVDKLLQEEKAEVGGFVGEIPEEPSRFFRGGSLKALQEVLHLPLSPGYIQYFVSKGDWSHWELVQHLLSHYAPLQLWFSTWSISELSARKLVDWIDTGMITSVTALVDYRAKNRHPAAYHLAQNHIAKLRVGSCHAKVTVLRNESISITIVGSANWTENPRIETGVISTNRELGNQHVAWINEYVQNGSYDL